MQAAVVVTLRYIKHVSVRVKARNMVVNEDCWHLLHQEAGEDDVEGNRWQWVEKEDTAVCS